MANCTDDITCMVCKKSFTMKKNLYAHERTIHGLKREKEPSKKNCPQICPVCGNMFTSKWSLQRHISTLHKGCTFMYENEILRNSRIKCSRCHMVLSSHNSLHEHLLNEHNMELIMENRNFNSEKEFMQWKKSVQLENNSSYVLDTSERKSPNGSVRKYYNCHRSHGARHCGKNIRPKGLKSIKTGTACPSRMEVLIKDGSYMIKFWKTHDGHSNDIIRRFLSKEIRTKIAEKLQQGVSFETILNEFRDSPVTVESEPLIFLKRKDLHNIARNLSKKQLKERRQLENEDKDMTETPSTVKSETTATLDIFNQLKEKLELISDLCSSYVDNYLSEEDANVMLRMKLLIY